MNELVLKAVMAAKDAGEAILRIYNTEFGIDLKDDLSPLTDADRASNDIINRHLQHTDFPVISEENKQIHYTERKTWNRCWIVDPLDGTKEFIKRNGEFTVNIAFCVDGRPTLGVIYVPVKRELFYADVEKGAAFKTILGENHKLPHKIAAPEDEICPAPPPNNILKVVASRSHLNPDTQRFINNAKGSYDEVEIVSRGSSLKFCMVAEGKAHTYPRFAPTMEWDTAAGQAICEAVGLEVISRDTQGPLLYNKENLLNPYFVVRHA